MFPEPSSPELKTEIGHVLFVDIVGYSKLLINEQTELLGYLKDMVRASEQIQAAEAESKLITLATGDGMALVFRNSPEAPARCALELSRADQQHPELRLRMGIHSGPINEVTDVNERANVTGAGINLAQRVMDCGDAGHILLSKRAADDLREYRHWQPLLHELGECEVKHNLRLSIVNLYTDELGNAELPTKFQTVVSARKPQGRSPKSVLLIGLLAAFLLGVILYWLGRRHDASQPAPSPSVIRSIAVLPFENLSRDPDNAFFADGVQDEILTNLAKIADLKVISRTSVMQYKTGTARNLREIGQQLGVAHLLEGSVQRAGNKVRVNAQLINAITDAHEWAENYDRPLDDVFAIQSEIAKAIADQLQAKIAAPQLVEMERKPTNNLQAYDAYLRGLTLLKRNLNSPDITKEVSYFREAVRLDPSFADAWAWLARELLLAYAHGDSRPADMLAEAREAVRKAYQLQPASVEANLAQGYLAYNGDGNYDAAAEWFEKARQLAPGDSEIYRALGSISRRQGKWQESAAYFGQAIGLSPLDPSLLAMQIVTLAAIRDYPALLKTCDALLNLVPDNKDILSEKIAAYQEMGDLAGAAALLPSKIEADDYALFDAEITQRIYERRYDEALVALKPALQKRFAPAAFAWRDAFMGDLAILYRYSGNPAAAQATAQQVCQNLLANYKEPVLTETRSSLAFAYAVAGDKAKAIAAAEPLHALKDAFIAVGYPSTMARIGALTADRELALTQLSIAVDTPGSGLAYGSGLTYGDLRFNPLWDSLRDDPRFQKIVESLKPKGPR